MPAIWLTWEVERRNRSLAQALGATLHEMLYKGNAVARYCALVWRTWRLIRRVKPRVIFTGRSARACRPFARGIKRRPVSAPAEGGRRTGSF